MASFEKLLTMRASKKHDIELGVDEQLQIIGEIKS